MLKTKPQEQEIIELRLENAELREENKQLRSENAELRAELAELRAEISDYKVRCEEYAKAYDELKHQVQALLRNRFGKKSERFKEDEPSEPDTGLEDSEDSSEKNRSARQRKPHPRKPFTRRIEIIPLSDTERICSCGCEKKLIRYETKDVLNYQPAVFEIIEQRREVATCPKGCDGSMVTAPAPLQILPKIGVSNSFLAFLIVSKLEDRQPLYHLQKQLAARHQIDCSRQSMARWLIELMEPLRPLYNLSKDQVIDYDVSSCDATSLQVLSEPGRRAETKSYVYCIRGGAPGREVVLYEYNDRLHKQFVQAWYEGFKGYLHVDGDNFFELIGALEDVNLVNCNAHARRKFEPIAQATKGRGLAKELLSFYKSLYKIERTAKEQKLIPTERYTLRLKESEPLMQDLKQWLDRNLTLVLPQAPLGKAIQYCLNRWEGLMMYLKDGRLEIDNNLTEQRIKPFVIARKNFLFSASVEGARALCMHFSFIETAKKHGLDPFHYYNHILKNIPLCKCLEDYEKLLPWNLTPEQCLKDT